MKKTWIRVTAVAALATGLMFAQPGPTPGRGKGGPRGENSGGFGTWQGRRLERMATILELTEAQRTQAQTIFDAAANEAKSLAPQLRELRTSLHEAVKSGNEAAIKDLAAKQAPLMVQMTTTRATALARFYALLTPEQKEKADKLHGLMGPGSFNPSMFRRR